MSPEPGGFELWGNGTKPQRHTSRRVWERLVDEHGARLAESTAREYVADARRRLGIKTVEVMVPQTHPLGAEAEVDFSSISFKLDGLQTEAWLFAVRLSGSGKTFRRAYWKTAQEVFLDCHVRSREATPRDLHTGSAVSFQSSGGSYRHRHLRRSRAQVDVRQTEAVCATVREWLDGIVSHAALPG